MMAIMADGSGNPMYGQSGFTAATIPEQKYWDKYSYGISIDDQIAYSRSHLGDGIGETRRWYGDLTQIVYWGNSWFKRGSNYNELLITGGIFTSYIASGELSNLSFRVILH